MPRMRILNKQEQVTFDQPPKFDSTQRKRFFDFPKSLLVKADEMHNPNSKIGLVYGKVWGTTLRINDHHL